MRPDDPGPAGPEDNDSTVSLLVASSGGHLDELWELADDYCLQDGRRVWVTAKTAQTGSLLQHEQVEWVPHVGSREFGRAFISTRTALRLLHRHRPQVVVSTGAALSTPYLIAARTLGIATHYIESATRVDSLSMVGRMAERVPGVHLHHQALTAPRGRWKPSRSVLDSFTPSATRPPQQARVLVLLGSERFPLLRPLHSIAAALPRDVDVTWQLGHTPAPEGLPGRVRRWIPFAELQDIVEGSDVVVSHCGVGSVLQALRAGKSPVVVPRRKRLGEHVDDHQYEFAAALCARGLAHVWDHPEEDMARLISRALATRVEHHRGAGSVAPARTGQLPCRSPHQA